MSDECQNCKKPEPKEGWYMVGGPAPLEFYCSAACLDHDLNGDPEDGYDAGEECGRWINGRLGKQCTKAGSEECDWDCPYSR